MADAEGAGGLLTVHDAARLLGVAPRTVERLRDRGLLPAVRVDGTRIVRYRRADVERLARVADGGGA